MRALLRVLIILLIVLIVVVGLGVGYGTFTVRRPWPQTDGTVAVNGLESEVTIIRDDWGIPHIYAANTHDLFFAQGYVHAQDRFWQMEFWRRIGTGRLSELMGPATLKQDRFLRTVGLHRTAAQELPRLSPEVRAALSDYAAGVNAYISTHRNRLGLEFTILGLTGVEYEPEPWTPLNTLTWAKVMAWDLGGNMNAELTRAYVAARLGTGAVDVLMPSYSDDYPLIVPHPLSESTLETVPAAAFDLHPLGKGDGIGSNNWVISGEHTETGMPLLANDPHLGIQMPSIWYEIGLHCQSVSDECPYNVVGASFAGAPGVIIGHNDHIAWGVTNLGPDVQDLFIEKVNPENPNQYEYEGEWRDMEIVREEIIVANEDEPVIVDVRLTHHGPIVNDVVGGEEEPWSFGWQPLALSWTALQPGTLFQSVLLLDQAQDWDDFRAALAYWDVPSQNFVYADREGNIGYQAPGKIPIRASGDGSMPVPGWNDEYEWEGFIPFDDLPRAFNPPEGYIVTANNAVVGPDFPYFISKDWSPGFRARRIVELIEADESLSIADIQAIQGDNAPIYAEDILPYLLVLPAEGSGREDQDARRLAEALELLRAWDRHATRDSTGALLFESFVLHLEERTFGDEAGEVLMKRLKGQRALMALITILPDPDAAWFDDVKTPEKEDRDTILLLALEDAIEELSDTMGSSMSRWKWEKVHTATFANQSLGQSGIAIIEAIFNRGPIAVDGTGAAVNNTAYATNEPYTVRVVPSYRQIVDMADFTRSVSMHTTGQSGHPYHPHYDDMIEPWRDIAYHPMLWVRADVESHAEGTLILRPASSQ